MTALSSTVRSVMSLESATYISALSVSDPPSTDPEGQGADHIRLLKSTLRNTFPAITGPVTATQVALNAAAALQATGAGEVTCPSLDSTVGGSVRLRGAPGLRHWLLRTVSNVLYFFVTGTDGTGAAAAATLDAAGNLSAGTIYSGTTPVSFLGEVRLFWGAAGSVPSGWHLCDGTAGTPDLRGRFPVGVGGGYGLGATGGIDAVALTTSHLPAHTHAVIDPGHAHGITDTGHAHSAVSDSQGGHAHTLSVPGGSGVAGGGISSWSGGGSTTQVTDTTAAHAHTITVAPNGTGVGINLNGSNVSVASSGLGGAFDNRPPFCALHFIMRIA